MVSCEKAIRIGALVYLILQSSIHMYFCILGIHFHKCKFKPYDKKGVSYFLYLTYFHAGCEKATFTEFLPHHLNKYAQLVFESGKVSGIPFPGESPHKKRNLLNFRLCIIFDTLLIITSALLIIVTCVNGSGLCLVLFYTPFLVILAVVIVYDAIVAAQYFADITATIGLSNWYVFLNKKENAVIDDINKVAAPMRTAWPAIFMAAFFSRGIVLWILNLLVFVFFLQIAVSECINRRRTTFPQWFLNTSCDHLPLPCRRPPRVRHSRRNRRSRRSRRSRRRGRRGRRSRRNSRSREDTFDPEETVTFEDIAHRNSRIHCNNPNCQMEYM